MLQRIFQFTHEFAVTSGVMKSIVLSYLCNSDKRSYKLCRELE